MFGLGKKKEENKSGSIDKLELLKQQLAELKAKEAQLDQKTQSKKDSDTSSEVKVNEKDNSSDVKVEGQQEILKESQNINLENDLTNSQNNTAKVYPSELNDEPPMVFKNRELRHYVGNVDGVVLEIGSGMSLNLPIRPRMDIDEFIQIAERVKALNALNFERN